MKYATISVPIEVKKALEKAKGADEWGKFLLDLYIEAKRLRSMKAFEELSETLTEEDLKTIVETSKTLREEFSFR